MPTLPQLLSAHGLEQYLQVFIDNDVDAATLRILTDADLKELGLPFGARKRLLSAVAGATVAGEADATTQLAVEQADMIRGKRLRPLATVSDKAVELEGYGRIPPLSETLPGFTAPANYFGIFIPKGVPDDVVKTVEKIWTDTIAKSDALKKYAQSRGALFNPLSGDAAQKAVFPAIQANAWNLHAAGKTKVAPDTVGIPKP